MSNLIYSYNQHKNLSESEIEILNDIYFKSLANRDFQGLDVFLKVTLTSISVFSILRMLVLAIKLKISQRASFIFTVTTSLATFSIIVYVSFIFWSSNNVFRTPSFPGSTECLSYHKLQLEKARTALYHWSTTAVVWLTIFICVVYLDYFKIKEMLLFLNEKSPNHDLFLYLFSLLLFTILATLPEILTAQITTNNRMNGSCYEWKFFEAYSISTFVFTEMGPCLVMLGIIVMIKYEVTRYQRKVRRRLGSSAMRLMSGVYDSAQGLKKSALYLMVIMFVTTFPSSVRHFLILIGVYDTRDYYLDESLCDIFDCLLLFRTSFPAAFCFKMKRHMDHFETVASQSAASRSRYSGRSLLPTRKFSLTLIDLMCIEEDYNQRAEDMYKILQSKNSSRALLYGSRSNLKAAISRLSSYSEKPEDCFHACKKLSTISQSDDVNSIKSIDLKDLVGERPKSADASISSGSNTNKVNMDGSF